MAPTRTVVWSLFLVAGLTSCLDDRSVVCDDGATICASFQVCAPSGGGCLYPEQLDACAGIADGTLCTSPAGPGVCDHEICSIASCGNGVVEVGEVCDDGNNANFDGCSATCLSNEQCGNGITELSDECDCGDPTHPGASRCMDPDTGMLTYNGGAICSSDCKLRYCGDGIVTEGEVCDDGNNVQGDGCSYQCQSNETCGNGFLDFSTGEQCDDDNTRRADGCGTTTCVGEPYAWETEAIDPSLEETGAIAARVDAVMAFDEARGRMVIFGGQVGATPDPGPGLTSERVDTTWMVQPPAASLTQRDQCSAVYDTALQRVVLFGGEDKDGTHADLWAYDGVAWQDVSPESNGSNGDPQPRRGAAMTYDKLRNKLVLFGGEQDGGGILGDTWILGGPHWTTPNVGPDGSPSARTGAAIAYDGTPLRNASVMFGGTNNTSGPGGELNETWTFDATWHLAHPTMIPPRRAYAAIAYDPEHQRVVMFGGQDAAGPRADTWTWNGSNWTQLIPTLSPTARSHASLAWDSVRHALVLTGGTNTVAPNVWELQDDTWVPAATVADTAEPTERSGAMVAYDTARSRVVLFGGIGRQPSKGFAPQANGTGAAVLLNDTWERVDGAWRAADPVTPGPMIGAAAVAYDPSRASVILFGGDNDGNPPYLDKTWAYDGTTWTEKTFTTKPSPRTHARMVWDAARQKIVLFGGLANTNQPLADTWELDAAGWKDVTPAASPPGRSDEALTFDPVRNVVVMFGGNAEQGATTGVVWEYNGTSWTSITPTNNFGNGPQAYNDVHFVFDYARNRPVLAAAMVTATLASKFRIYEWDGVRFSLSPGDGGDRDLSSNPLGGIGIVYDAPEHAILFIGGRDRVNTSFRATKTLGYRPHDAAEACFIGGTDYDHDGKTGCADDECWPYCAPFCAPGVSSASCP